MKALILIVAFVITGCGHDNNNQANNPQNAGGTEQAPTPTPSPTPQQKYFVKNGHWAGEGISLEVGNPQSTYELSCAHGTIDQPLQLNKFNHFSATGTIIVGPPRPPDQEVAYKTHFDGTVVGDLMDLTIRYTPDGQTEQSQNYRLQYNSHVGLIKCL